jgi:HAD superfamily hydrolase (TIGR01509 family)
VACRFVPERRLAALARLSGLPQHEVHARIWESGLEDACERGELTAQEATARVSRALEQPLALDALAAAWALAFEPDPAVLEIADAIRVRVAAGLLTNNGPLLFHALPKALPEVAQRFDPLLFSCRLRAVKPTAALFAAVLREVGHPAGEVLLIDDSPANIDGARAAGLAGILYREPEALRRDLSEKVIE